MLGLELTPEHPVADLVELGTQAEREGYDSLFVSCHYNNRDPFAVLARLAAETDDIRLGPGVANPYEMHPVTLAAKVATVAESSGGRGLLGIGPGDPSTLRNLGLEDERGLRSVLEAFKVAQDLWNGKRVSHDGTFEANDAGLNFDVPGEIPVYVGGEGPHMCRMAGKHADGLLFNGSHPDDLAWAREQVDIGREDRPDERGEFTLAAYASVSISEDEDAAREAARPPVAFITAGAAPPVLDRHGIDAERASDIGEKISAGAFSEAFGLVTPAMIDAFSMAGSPDDVADQMAAVRDYADGIVVGSPIGPDLEEAITLAAEAYCVTEQ
ncbi:5,10-methylenetetrahydromethanopterin reductase [Haloferax mediterranei ATCC 33500]|uniref:5,10-methylenetetrahydromethanopterin reductase n=1 Tax=Haloferax mediterranei (strain ATCC 33500 / DSM 1411 / JCM 8866 / NBRC 14739 / NCIMB 2177 / R-4) TaxID=523841 RepID=I3R662_HALMT|nr:5,10-methylenetetrahydromethanopterin reductase [Haloferax mediterranei]AFK19722.1 coenzyme F420-dependent N5,N10-methenyltetrahydromethanopterin reductase [Haloferax mediterranei ATCC 33500]AHZ23110.1 5,10-methylenetetrahydrofolate reductase [Haloferax mediterranei ATCC 33500]EMA00044.1 methylenetetrahydromethanopterin reductase [Haloferax mediterranei ATCC 33500]MDX5987533.1 5,10-methylenetetrahydromethanopterin reductase [Haloferax mediterranei ATCC 33500]QCQ74030.1 5,10-methylenetetrahy